MKHLEEEKNKKLDPNMLKKFQLMPFFKNTVMKIWELINRLLNSIIKFVRKEPANLVLTLSTVLTIIGLSYLLALIVHPFRTGGNITIMPGKNTMTTMEEFDGYESLALLQRNYITWQSINAWILTLRLLFDFTFSGELSLVLEVVGEALFDITFFIFMFFIIMFGFSLNGYLLFGLDTYKFRNIGRALIQNLLMIISDNSSDYLTDIDYVIGLVYYFLFMGIFFMILLKMFIAILDGQFTETTEKGNDDAGANLGFVDLIVQIGTETVMKYVKIFTNEKKDPNEIPYEKLNRRQKIFRKGKAYFKKLITLLQELLIGGSMSKEETDKLQKAAEKNVMKVNLDFKKDFREDRTVGLDDLKFYINADGDGKRKTIKKNDEDSSDFDADNEHADILEDDKAIAHRWMISLEETLTRMSGGKL